MRLLLLPDASPFAMLQAPSDHNLAIRGFIDQ